MSAISTQTLFMRAEYPLCLENSGSMGTPPKCHHSHQNQNSLWLFKTYSNLEKSSLVFLPHQACKQAEVKFELSLLSTAVSFTSQPQVSLGGNFSHPCLVILSLDRGNYAMVVQNVSITSSQLHLPLLLSGRETEEEVMRKQAEKAYSTQLKKVYFYSDIPASCLK